MIFKPVLVLLRVLLYSFSALYIKQHTKGVSGIRTGTLKQAKGLSKAVKELHTQNRLLRWLDV